MSAPASVGGVMAGGGKRSVTPSTPTRPGAAFAQMAGPPTQPCWPAITWCLRGA